MRAWDYDACYGCARIRLLCWVKPTDQGSIANRLRVSMAMHGQQ
jgi:hypothetical protein